MSLAHDGDGQPLVQTPRGVLPLQLYGTVGAGGYRERYSPFDENEYGFGTNLGGGAKINLVGPLRLRVDYRIFRLGNDCCTMARRTVLRGRQYRVLSTPH